MTRDGHGSACNTSCACDDTWSAIWLRALDVKGAGPHAFVVVDGAGEVTCSEPFTASRRKTAVPLSRDCTAFRR